MSEAKWTTQPPTEPGWYWFAPYERAVEILNVQRVMGNGELRAYGAETSNWPVGRMEGTWYSEPLSVPGPNAK